MGPMGGQRWHVVVGGGKKGDSIVAAVPGGVRVTEGRGILFTQAGGRPDKHRSPWCRV